MYLRKDGCASCRIVECCNFRWRGKEFPDHNFINALIVLSNARDSLRDTITKHGPITKNVVGSAAKRVIGQLSGEHTRRRVLREASRLATQPMNSENLRFPRAEALDIAKELCDALKPVCSRLTNRGRFAAPQKACGRRC